MIDSLSLSPVSGRAPIAILGVPFDNLTMGEAIETIDHMVASRQPHYLVTANVDFLVQASTDVELRRILFDAHLVLCDGTPVLWASRLLGNPLQERVAGSDLVPLLIEHAASRQYRLFFLGATPDSVSRAVERLRKQYPEVIVAGHYSPPFNQLLEMDHDEIKRRILDAKPDLLFVSLGCPKQEKWMAMHYRALSVPVCIGVGATIDFLAGQVKRAPAWMRRCGTEWLFRLGQEPRRLYRRYAKDLWVFGRAICAQWWRLRLQVRPARGIQVPVGSSVSSPEAGDALGTGFQIIRAPNRLDCAAMERDPLFSERALAPGCHCLFDLEPVEFIDSTGVGMIIRLHKRLCANQRFLVLVAPSRVVKRALAWMGLDEFFIIAASHSAARQLIAARIGAAGAATSRSKRAQPAPLVLEGEITAANAEVAWEQIHSYLMESGEGRSPAIDLSDVFFIDSTGLGLLVKAKKLARSDGKELAISGARPAVQNVVRLARLKDFL